MGRVGGLFPAVGVPLGIADVVVAVAAHVVEVGAEQRLGYGEDFGVVEEGAEGFVLVDEGDDAGAGFARMGLAVVAAAALLPDGFEGGDYFFAAVGEEAGEAEVAEGVEELDLLGG